VPISRRPAEFAPAVVYDAGALIAAERGDRGFLVTHDELLRVLSPLVPDVVLAQVWRGTSRQAKLSRVLVGCRVVDTGEQTARAAGVACGKAGTSDVVDAIVVVCAVAVEAIVFTSDPDDLQRVAAGLGVPLRLHNV